MSEERATEIEYVPREVFNLYLQRINDRVEIEKKIDRLAVQIEKLSLQINHLFDIFDIRSSANVDTLKNELKCLKDLMKNSK